jgi:hypothetical protein
VISRETGEQHLWGCDHAEMRTRQKVIAENVTARRTRLSTEEWQSEPGRYPFHATVGHGGREWAWDEDGMADANSPAPAIHVKGQVRRFVLTCALSEVFTSSTGISIWRHRKAWSIRTA